MTLPTTAPALGALPAISLEDLVQRASRQTRVDRKYLVPAAQLDAVVAELTAPGDGPAHEPGTTVLEIDGLRDFAYESVYFDTPDLTSYLGAAHRRRRRFKIRTRAYVDSGSCWVEVKTRGARGTTVKNRLEYDLDHQDVLTGDGRRFAEDVLVEHEVPARIDADLLPVLVSRYRRTTLHLPGTDSRTTIDTDLTWTSLGLPGGTGGERTARLEGLVVVETKTGSTPSATDRVLWRHGIRPVRISKFGTGLAALHHELPCTPWRRVLDRHVTENLRAA